MDGQSHVVHSEEEALGTRLTIDSLVCLLANETDPSKLLAISPGKLMRYLVPDEGNVVADQPYAEIEVSTAASRALYSLWAFLILFLIAVLSIICAGYHAAPVMDGLSLRVGALFKEHHPRQGFITPCTALLRMEDCTVVCMQIIG